MFLINLALLRNVDFILSAKGVHWKDTHQELTKCNLLFKKITVAIVETRLTLKKNGYVWSIEA